MRGKDKSLVLVWAGLLLLLGATAASARASLGAWNTVLNMGIAVLKSALVMLFFMRLFGSHLVVRLAALAGLATLAILFALSGSDYATRGDAPAPFQAPRQLPPKMPGASAGQRLEQLGPVGRAPAGARIPARAGAVGADVAGGDVAAHAGSGKRPVEQGVEEADRLRQALVQ
jgi:cytochrome c oxidase subunit 4